MQYKDANELSCKKLPSRMWAWFERFVYYDHGWCKCCRRPWHCIKNHSTRYRVGSDCFALCQSCWKQLIPIARLPFYRQLWEKWQENSNEVPWVVIEAACLYEQDYESIGSLEEGLQRLRDDSDRYIAVTGNDPYFMMPRLSREIAIAWGDRPEARMIWNEGRCGRPDHSWCCDGVGCEEEDQ